MEIMDDFEGNSQSFLEWFRQQPDTAFHSSLKIVDLRNRGAGRGIIATTDIPAETDLFSIPRGTIISVETSELAKRIPELFVENAYVASGRIPDTDVDSLPHAWLSLILVLLYESLHHETSQWLPYLSILPRTSEGFNTLMFWSDEELKDLQASAIPSKIGRESANEMFREHIIPAVKQHVNVFYPSTDPSTHLSDDQLIETCHVIGSLIMSYAFDLQPDEDEDHVPDEDNEESAEGQSWSGWTVDKSKPPTMGMVPMADLLNADAEFNAHLSHGDDSLTMTSLRDIKAGEEVLNYYGPLPNGELLRRYGYTSAKHTRYDVVEIGWDLVKSVLNNYTHESETMEEKQTQLQEITKVLGEMEEDESRDVRSGYLLERESDDPSDEGFFTTEAKFTSLPEGMIEDISDFVSSIIKADTKKRKADDDDEEARTTLLKREALNIMQSIITQRIKQYATTARADDLQLRKERVSGRQKMAVEVRLGEKKVLDEALAWVKEKKQKYSFNGVSGTRKRQKR